MSGNVISQSDVLNPNVNREVSGKFLEVLFLFSLLSQARRREGKGGAKCFHSLRKRRSQGHFEENGDKGSLLLSASLRHIFSLAKCHVRPQSSAEHVTGEEERRAMSFGCYHSIWRSAQKMA